MGNIKVLGSIAVVFALLIFILSSPLYVSISFDVERDPTQANRGGESFEGIEVVDSLLDVMEEHGARGTFFVTGRIVERFPKTVKIIGTRGHEVGAHGGFYHDEVIAGLPVALQKEKILETKTQIENVTGERVLGYRAPGHRLDENTLLALEELGFEYDSSVVPSIGGRALYKHSIFSPDAPYHPNKGSPFVRGDMGMLEIPITPVFINGNLDSLLAYQGAAITRVELLLAALECKIKKKPMVLYLHPGMMAGTSDEASSYRGGEYLISEFDAALTFLDLLGARYVALEEIKSL
ncbi:polysaccharide deacetylase family protein [archaeon]|nr:polysaccharide deacetylase family protein [archaeon]